MSQSNGTNGRVILQQQSCTEDRQQSVSPFFSQMLYELRAHLKDLVSDQKGAALYQEKESIDFHFQSTHKSLSLVCTTVKYTLNMLKLILTTMCFTITGITVFCVWRIVCL